MFFFSLCIKGFVIKCTQVLLFLSGKFNVYHNEVILFMSRNAFCRKVQFSGVNIVTTALFCVSPGIQTLEVLLTQ